MASKFGLAGGIPERRVRPIWDAVDTRQFKNGLKLSVALLAKYPNSPYALALKALILERMGKNEEALSVCLNAKEILCSNDPKTVVDDLTLSTLQIVFQRLDHLDMATSCYEYACAKYSEKDLMIGLFNCYVREYSFVKQQQIAIKMYKIWSEERFLLWAVCSIQLQVYCGNGGEKLLLLAEGLLKKHVSSHDLQDPEALSIYISLLEKQCKYAEALEILSGKLGSLMMIEVDRLCLQGRLLARAGDFTAAANVFQKVLELCPDDWECFLQYLGCLLENETVLNKDIDPTHPTRPVVCKDLYISEELFDSRMSNAVNFIQKLVEGNCNTIRCPYLALLEIERQKVLLGKGDVDKVAEDLMQYFIRFGHLACFISDVEQFLQVLDSNKKTEFLKKLVKEHETIVNEPTKALGCSISVFKIQNLLGDLFTLPVEDLENVAMQMTKMFCKNLPLSKELDLQETMYGEELLSLACNLLVQVFWRTRDLGYLLESIMILEFGLAVRRYVWQYKISLVHLYSYWGSLPLAYERYKNLDVKNILLETVSHHILPQMLASPFWSDLKDLLLEYIKFMDDHLRESADLTFLAYRHKSYSKVIEFVQFKEGLQRSSQYLVVKVESAILQLKQNSGNLDDNERIMENLGNGTHFVELSSEIRDKSMTFNEDLNLRPWWTPTYDRNYLLGPFEGVSFFPSKVKDNYIKQSQDNVLRTVEKRSLLPRIIYLSMHSASSSAKGNNGANGSIVDPKLSSELKILLERHAKILDLAFHDAVELLLGISSGERSIEVPCSDIIHWVNFAVFLNAWNLRSHEITGSSTWKLVNSLLTKFLVEKIKCAGPLTSSPGSDLPFLVQLVSEPLAWHALIIQSCVRSLFPSGKKKKKGGSVEQSNTPLYREIQESIHSLCDSLELVTNWLEEQLAVSNEEKLETIFSSIDRNDTSNGPGKVFRALQSSISLMKNDEVGDRIFEAVHLWNPPDIARRMIAGQDSLLSEFLQICKSKIKLLQSLRLRL